MTSTKFRGEDHGIGHQIREEVVVRSALALARKGLRVFPCVVAGKQPATAHGCKDATVDPSVISAWWRQLPDANIGVATGAASGIFVVDVDGLDAEAELRKLEVQHGALPATIEVITARGRHIYLRMPGAVVRNTAGKIAPGIDTRGDGGYVLAPPSVHPSGRRYAWSVDCGPGIAAAPPWLLARIEAPASNGNGATPPSEWRALVTNGVAEGARDTTVTKITGHLLRRHIDPVVVLELMQAWNATRCAPPLPAADIERVVASIAAKELRRRSNA
jgi:hypothetical protein